MAESVYTQPDSGVRFDWGLAGATELARVCAVLVVVDVLSFTTAVTVAAERGIRVHPFPWHDQADEYARRIGAVAATGRTGTTPQRPWSLSPAALRAARPVPDLVLPSPNGSTICAAAEAVGVPVVAGCLRNAAAVAGMLRTEGYGTAERPVGVIAAGERWPDGGLRPAVEDLLGAAAVLDGLTSAELSIEAATTVAVLATIGDVPAAVRGGVSGRELIGRGFGADVEIATEIDASIEVPVLRGGTFAGSHRPIPA